MQNDSQDTFPKRLSSARALSRLSGRRLAQLANVSASYVLGLERGRWPHAGADAIGRIADVLGLSLDWLTYGRGDAPTPESIARAVAVAEYRHAGVNRTGRSTVRCQACGAVVVPKPAA